MCRQYHLKVSRGYTKSMRYKLPASKQTFVADKGRMTVAEYSKSRGRILKYPKLHCLHVGPPQKTIYLPIGMCAAEGKQSVNRNDATLQSAAMDKIAATSSSTSTNARKSKIMELLHCFIASTTTLIRPDLPQ
ncbi:protein argonaute-2-like [Drosophila obscura]|uniref:protein argonaute-2-like n=1 Tax=Drosophila obscura TaxID=7282 RepID=UPI001BB13CFC|nr:protein argonaute-2-like [Drosophila obscura]